MKKFLRLVVAVASLTLGASAGSAATLGLSQAAAPMITSTGTFFSLPGVIANFQGFGGTSTPPAEASNLQVALNGLLGTDATATGFALNVGPGTPPIPFLSATLSDFGFEFSDSGSDRLEFLLTSVGGTQSAAFGGALLAFVDGEFGSEASFFANGTFGVPIDAQITIAPVPLPGSIVALATAVFGAAGFLRFGAPRCVAYSRRNCL